MGLRVVQFLVVILTALALVPAGAHFFELANKIGLAQEQYFTVQGIYRGWALFGFPLFGALILDFALALMLRQQAWPFRLALLGTLCIAASLAIFFTWAYPANQATRNWTVVPENWSALRAQWEYAHAASAVLTFTALCSLVLSVLGASLRADDRGALSGRY